MKCKIIQLLSIICAANIRSSKDLFYKYMIKVDSYSSNYLKKVKTEAGYERYLSQKVKKKH
ncbi:hypothetical protein FZC35_02400 [Candidatus Cytomitobacter indipagum]|uniref:Uncharacterized protein n=1 Tax=Candidatus Cytomitobacter indipagum TaxID=2601575 RepID=A0A5C0UDS1_9PROT|nr:hypothetical protein [Candidatus Cytomitobacter indipagum]QEK38205.1 hypothetical protein FZC35_02400 [Candidatus Cytomitobacter indipagum]